MLLFRISIADRSLRAGSQERSAAPATCAGPETGHAGHGPARSVARHRGRLPA